MVPGTIVLEYTYVVQVGLHATCTMALSYIQEVVHGTIVLVLLSI